MDFQEFMRSLSGESGNLRGTSFLNGAYASFFYKLVSQWYLLIAIPAMNVTYNVLKALEDSGVLKNWTRDLKEQLALLLEVSTKCPQLITDLDKFANCLGW